MKILVINGPNLNFLGIREKGIYGTTDYSGLVKMIEEKGKMEGDEILIFQSNYEGAIIDRIQEAYFDGTEGIVINPGAYTHTSIAILDALKAVSLPAVEVHISDISVREPFRQISYPGMACVKTIKGHGLDGYREAILYLKEHYS